MKFTIILIAMLLTLSLASAEKSAYKIFESDGDETDYEEMADDASDAQVVFFGELHNNPICHWLQLELTKSLFENKGQDLILGAEMFEADVQLVIDEYFSGKIPQANFEKEARLWNNYKTDYKPLLEFAKENDLKFIATNIPRRYASFVARNGLEKLNEFSEQAKNYFAPLPIKADLTLKSYTAMDDMTVGIKKTAQKSKKSKSMKDINEKMKDLTADEKKAKMKKMMDTMNKLKYFKEAQASKDATMAHFILSNMNDKKTFLHYNGTYHSNNYEGIVWFIKRDSPDYTIVTIASVLQSDLEDLEEQYFGLADFIIVIPKNMTSTY